MIPRHETNYILEAVCGLDELLNMERFEHLDREGIDQILDTVDRLTIDHFASIAQEMDATEVFMKNGAAVLHAKAGEGLQAAADAGIFGTTFSIEDHGSQLPHCVSAAINSTISGANTSLNAFIGLTAGSARLIATYGDSAQREAFLEPMVSGRFFGTMCLSESHAGSSLAEIRTRAELTENGAYKISGEKMWITAGDHPLGENIIHLVLARLPDAPPGVKGISLFIVPKYRLNQDGTRGAANDVQLIGLNHKLGQRGVPNAVLRFGDAGECEGYLLGRPNFGMFQMFQMMNELRMSVGAVSSGIAYEGAQQARAYAAERKQGKSLDAEGANAPQVEIIEHPDVRRMLLSQRALSEGALALAWYCAALLDRIECNPRGEEAEKLRRRLDLLTPLVKTWPAEQGTRANDISLQVLGGAGYTRDFPVERLYRDNRLNPIHEGTTGIQSLDLLRRKVLGEEGRSLMEFLDLVQSDCRDLPASLEMEGELLRNAVSTATRTAETLLHAQREQLPASKLYGNATPFLEMIGSIVVGWLWIKKAHAAQDRISRGIGDKSFLRSKLVSCSYFIKWELPKAMSVAQLVADLDPTWIELDREALLA
jgi:alkylation response protein AidB-like acyl-CoA dehydrogenase